jgi:hypothetical protein
MKTCERRATRNYPYFKLAAWDARSFTWKDGKVQFATEGEAEASARKPGRYRASRVEESGRIDLDPFYRP